MSVNYHRACLSCHSAHSWSFLIFLVLLRQAFLIFDRITWERWTYQISEVSLNFAEPPRKAPLFLVLIFVVLILPHPQAICSFFIAKFRFLILVILLNDLVIKISATLTMIPRKSPKLEIYSFGWLEFAIGRLFS